jgi:hypothetical protein
MKFLILLVLAVAGGSYVYSKGKEKQQDALNPEVITNPVYAEIRLSLSAGGRDLEMVLLAKTTGEAECSSASTGVGLIKRQVEASHWKIKSTECKAELAPRYAGMFEGRPTHLTYLSIARGARTEREIRMVNWGLSAGESDKLCDDMVAVMQRTTALKGPVTCVRGVKT